MTVGLAPARLGLPSPGELHRLSHEGADPLAEVTSARVGRRRGKAAQWERESLSRRAAASRARFRTVQRES